jgi:hypothetical protein
MLRVVQLVFKHSQPQSETPLNEFILLSILEIFN